MSEPVPAEPVRGSCLCGAVTLEIARFDDVLRYCHCTQCRKQSGHHYAAVRVRLADLEVRGDDAVRWYAASDEAERGFCATCGSALFWRRRGAGSLSVLAGCLDGPTGLAGAEHIFVADKGDYYALDDGLPQHARSD